MDNSQYIQIRKCAEDTFSPKSKAREISDYLSDNTEDIFSPVLMMKKFHISMKEITSFMLELEELGYINTEFYLKCPSCKNRLPEKVSLFRDIPDTFECPVCKLKSLGLKNAFVIFRLKKTD